MSQFGHQPELAHRLTNLWKRQCCRLRIDQTLAVQQQCELRPPLREPIDHLGRFDIQARFLTQTNFFMDQPQGGFRAQLGMAVEKCLGCKPFTPPPRGDHLVNKLRRQRAGAGARAEEQLMRPRWREIRYIA